MENGCGSGGRAGRPMIHGSAVQIPSPPVYMSKCPWERHWIPKLLMMLVLVVPCMVSSAIAVWLRAGPCWPQQIMTAYTVYMADSWSLAFSRIITSYPEESQESMMHLSHSQWEIEWSSCCILSTVTDTWTDFLSAWCSYIILLCIEEAGSEMKAKSIFWVLVLWQPYWISCK